MELRAKARSISGMSFSVELIMGKSVKKSIKRDSY